jgi:hypothetical protein
MQKSRILSKLELREKRDYVDRGQSAHLINLIFFQYFVFDFIYYH